MTTQSEAVASGNPSNSDAYYLQPDGAGASEAYAESFARFVSHDPTLQTDWPAIYKYWSDINQGHSIRLTN